MCYVSEVDKIFELQRGLDISDCNNFIAIVTIVRVDILDFYDAIQSRKWTDAVTRDS